MENSHLITVLKTFSKKEMRDFKKWIQSPSHNLREDVVLLFQYLTSGNHLFEEKYLQKERIFNKLYPKETFDDAKLRQSKHFLLKAIEEFLIYNELASDSVRSKMALASVYRKRKLDKAFQKTIKSVNDLQKNAEFRNENFFRNEYLLQEEEYKYQEGKKRSVKMNLQEVSDSLDKTYIADKLRQSCLMLSHQKVFKTEYTPGLLDPVLEFTRENNLLHIPAIALYYYIYMALTEPKETQYFHSLKENMFEFGHLFPKAEIRDIYLMAINYCIGKLNIGDKVFIREAFELFRKGITNDVLIEKGRISKFSFRNIVNLGTHLEEFDWIEHFVQEYKDCLDPNSRENLVKFSQAKIQFAKGHFDKAMRLLAQFEDDDILINLSGKNMLIRMYFEEGEFDALESLLDSMRTYVNRKEMLTYHKFIYTNLIKYTRKLIRVNPYDKKQRSNLRQELETAKPLPERAWFLQQLDGLN